MNQTDTDLISEATAGGSALVAPQEDALVRPAGGAGGGAPTVEERIDSAEKTLTSAQTKIRGLTREVSDLFWFVMVLVICAIAATAISALVSGHTLKVREASVEELLRPGTHCYGSSQERDAAAQRALAAIDRLHWEQTQALTRMSTGSPAALPTVTDDVAAQDDPDVCFTVAEPVHN